MIRSVKATAVILLTAILILCGCNAGVITSERANEGSTFSVVTDVSYIYEAEAETEAETEAKTEEQSSTNAKSKDETTKAKSKNETNKAESETAHTNVKETSAESTTKARTTAAKDDKKSSKKNNKSTKTTNQKATETPTSKANANNKETTSNNAKTTESEASAYCTVTIECTDIFNYMKYLDKGHEAYLPKDGYFLRSYKCEYKNGDSVYDILTRSAQANSIKLSTKKTSFGMYVSGINNIDEFDVGRKLGWTSGWIYRVNGSFANRACDKYDAKPKDEIVFSYSCKAD